MNSSTEECYIHFALSIDGPNYKFLAMGASVSYESKEANEEKVDKSGNKHSRSTKQSRWEAKVDGVTSLFSEGNTRVNVIFVFQLPLTRNHTQRFSLFYNRNDRFQGKIFQTSHKR